MQKKWLLFRVSPKHRLWCGHFLGLIGNEVSRIALGWLLVESFGEKTMIFHALPMASALLGGIFIGSLIERWERLRAMVWLDLIRAVLIALLPLVFISGPFHQIYLVILIVTTAALSAGFDPLVYSLISDIVEDKNKLEQFNNLLDGAKRFARVFGPMLAGYLAYYLSPPEALMVDSFTYLCSALSLFSLIGFSQTQRARPRIPASQRPKFWQSFRELKKTPILRRFMTFEGIVWGAWYGVYMSALPLLIKQKNLGGMGLFGLVMGAYGLGNLLANVWRFQRKTQAKAQDLYLCWAGLGLSFILLGLAADQLSFVIGSFVGGLFAPMGDLAYLGLVQKSYGSESIGRIFRLRFVLNYAWSLLWLVGSVGVLSLWGPHIYMALAGVACLLASFDGARLVRHIGKEVSHNTHG